MKKALLIVAFDKFRDEEYAEPRRVLEEAGWQVTVASSQLGTATGKLGLKVKVDATLDKVIAKDFDAVMFVGGPGANVYYHDPLAHQLAKGAIEHNKVLGAICGAPPILAYAGVLKGKKATMFTDTGDLAKGGATHTGQGVEVDGKIITATGPHTAKAWAEAIIESEGNI